VPLLVRLAGRLAFSEEEMRGGWGYYYALACGFERLACAEGVAPLHRVKASVLFQNRVVGRSADVRGCSNVPHERLAYLSMALARALSRCGDQEGALQLCEFLSEARVCLARAARAELAAATGQDYGYDAGLWRSWIRDNGSKLRPNPLTKDFA
jgi:hypothetical protein